MADIDPYPLERDAEATADLTYYASELFFVVVFN